MTATTSAIRAKSLFYTGIEIAGGRDEILFLGNRGLIIKSSSDSITVRFQRWYSFTTDFHSRFPPLRNIFLGGGGTFAPCLFSIYHTKVETVARVYRAIFYSLSSLPLLHSLLIFRSRPFVTLHYLLLRNVVDASFPLRCAGKISGANRFAISSIHKRGTNRRRFFCTLEICEIHN